MKKVKILGTGCAKCKKTERMVRKVVEKNDLEVSVEKVEDIEKIMEYNVLSTPAVVVDEEVKISGRVPSESDIMDVLK